ncbi:MAG: hypothetical protein HW389_2972, partial [Bacteroidetes bacterium]|nr:hypothetical protein [Bacteroidota bacterium]
MLNGIAVGRIVSIIRLRGNAIASPMTPPNKH